MKKYCYLLSLVLVLIGSGTLSAHRRSYYCAYKAARMARKAEYLAQAACFGDLERVKWLSSKIGVNARTFYRFAPLMVAANAGQEEVVAYLLDKGARVNARNYKGYTALMYAVRMNRYAVAKKLLECGAEVHSKSRRQGHTPLMLAVVFGHYDLVKLLLEKGADKNARDRRGKTALYYAKKLGREKIAELVR